MKHECPMCGFSPSSGREPVWHADPGIVERGGKFVIVTRAQARLFDALWHAMKRRAGPLTAPMLAHSIYADNPDGGPLSFKTLICTNAKELDGKLQAIGPRVRAQGARGYQLTFSEFKHEMVA